MSYIQMSLDCLPPSEGVLALSFPLAKWVGCGSVPYPWGELEASAPFAWEHFLSPLLPLVLSDQVPC